MKGYEVDIAVVGGGPAGIAAALAASNLVAKVLVIDRGDHLGGQLVKQTHKFFGSRLECAGVRGIEIAEKMIRELKEAPKAEIWTGSTALGYYSDKVLLVSTDNMVKKVSAGSYIFCTGANEKSLLFPNNDLPGIFGAGAVQTLMNLYGVLAGKRFIIIGSGNIGLIVSYQLAQAGAEVVGVVEALPTIGGYSVHASKIRRLGIPIWTGETVKEAHGTEHLEGVTLKKMDSSLKDERKIDVDVMCVAVGLSPLAELLWMAGCKMDYIPELGGHAPVTGSDMQTTIPGVFAAGDVVGIEEASTAIIGGRLAGLEAARFLGFENEQSEELRQRAIKDLEILRGGPTGEKIRAGIAKLRQNLPNKEGVDIA